MVRGLLYGDTIMFDTVNLTQGTAISSSVLGVVGVVTAPDLQNMGLSVVAVLGGVLSLIMAAYGNYRKINKEYGVDAYAKVQVLENQVSELAKQNDKLHEFNSELLDQLKIQNQLLSRINATNEAVAASTAVSAEIAVQQAAKTTT